MFKYQFRVKTCSSLHRQTSSSSRRRLSSKYVHIPRLEVTFIKHHNSPKTLSSVSYLVAREQILFHNELSLPLLDCQTTGKREKLLGREFPWRAATRLEQNESLYKRKRKKLYLHNNFLESSKEEKFSVLLIKFIAARAIHCHCVSAAPRDALNYGETLPQARERRENSFCS